MDKPPSQTQTPRHPFQPKPTKPHRKSPMLTAPRKSPACFRRRSRRKPGDIAKKVQRDGGVLNCEEAEEKEVIERKIRSLQGIVPGGESLGVDKLFEQTAEYIMALQYQVKAMRALSSFFESFDKEKSNCGS